eukprot:scaffold110042_cov55-Phaeocystis_antarctica.AAC.1
MPASLGHLPIRRCCQECRLCRRYPRSVYSGRSCTHAALAPAPAPETIAPVPGSSDAGDGEAAASPPPVTDDADDAFAGRRSRPTAPQQRPSRRRRRRRAGSQRCRRRQLFACFIQVMDQLHPKARRPRRALHLRCEVCALQPRRTPWPPRMPCTQEPPGAPESRASGRLAHQLDRQGWLGGPGHRDGSVGGRG